MTLMKLIATGLACAILSALPAAAEDFDLSPAACQDAVADYIASRLDNPRGAKVHMTSDPYKVMVRQRGRDVAAWAVDVRVKARLPSGSWSGQQRYTVIFKNGSAVALRGDLDGVTRA